MLKERLAVANKLASDLHAAEAAIDEAIMKIGTLMAALPQAQVSTKLSSVATDQAFAHLGGAINGMMAGRTNIVALHNELSSIQDKIGLRNVVVGTGGLGKLVPKRTANLESDDVVATHSVSSIAA